ncbi:MAG: PepSY domain-containing protein [Alphaproteobacteria bacterium]|nr:MAG: PepSY domain-containing protein [Alphaproteobacteria bacterium]
MRKLVLIAAMTLATPVFASQLATDALLGTSAEEVKANLAQLGYEVRKSQMEDGFIEVYALKDGSRYEVYVDAGTGRIVRLKVK